MIRYRSRRPDDRLAGEASRACAGAASLRLPAALRLLRREGETWGKNRVYRLYREEKLAVRKRQAGAAAGCRAPMPVEVKPTRAGRSTSSTTVR